MWMEDPLSESRRVGAPSRARERALSAAGSWGGKIAQGGRS